MMHFKESLRGDRMFLKIHRINITSYYKNIKSYFFFFSHKNKGLLLMSADTVGECYRTSTDFKKKRKRPMCSVCSLPHSVLDRLVFRNCRPWKSEVKYVGLLEFLWFNTCRELSITHSLGHSPQVGWG